MKSHPWMKDFDKVMSSHDQAEGEDDEAAVGGDDDMEVRREVQTICPITRKEMVRPVKNSACGHVYDREGIDALMRQSHGNTRCPVVGCRNQGLIRPIDLQDDKATKRAIAARKNN